MGGGFILFGIILVGFLLFCVYFIFKQIEFVLVSVNLYEKMVAQQHEMLRLLTDIRDNAKKYALVFEGEHREARTESAKAVDHGREDPQHVCRNCGEQLPATSRGSTDLMIDAKCPKCGWFTPRFG